MNALVVLLVAGALAAVGVVLVRSGAAGAHGARSSVWRVGARRLPGPLGSFAERSDRRRDRERLIAQLPDALDLMAVALDAGVSPEVALAVVADVGAPPLADQLRRVEQEIALGAPPREAYRAFADRVDREPVRDLVEALERAETLGTPIGQVVAAQGAAQRRERARRARERAARAAPKIQLVIALLMVPATLALVVGLLLLELARQVGAVVGGGG